MNSAESEVLKNARNWLRLIFHCMICSHAPGSCPLKDRCTNTKELLVHVVSCSRDNCTVDNCRSTGRLLLHYISCKDECCPLCCGVWSDLQTSFNSASSVLRRDGSQSSDASSIDTPKSASSAQSDCQLSPSGRNSSNDSRNACLRESSKYFIWLLHNLMRKDMSSPSVTGEPACPSSGKQLWQHLLGCPSDCCLECCKLSKRLLRHRLGCQTPTCSLCSPVVSYFQRPQTPVLETTYDISNRLVEELNRQLQALLL